MFSVTLLYFIFILLLLLVCLISGLTKIISGKAALICALVILCAAGGSLFLTPVQAYFNIPTYTPDVTAAAFAESLTAGDLNALSTVYSGSYDMQCEADGAGEQALFSAALRYECRCVGEYEKGYLAFRQNVELTHTDLPAMAEAIRARAAKTLEKYGAEELRSTVYESDRTYKQSVARRAFDEAAGKVDPADFTVTETVPLTLICRRGQWRVQVTRELVECLHCGLGTGSLKTLVEKLEGDSVLLLQTETPYVYKHYSIDGDYSAPVPAPDEKCYGETDDPAVMQAVIDGAGVLLDGQTTVWSPDRELMPGSLIHYYCDESILTIVWREVHNDSVCTFAEIKLADASQLRRRLTGDSYGSQIWIEGSQIAAASNAVLATGGDLYAFRELGITSYEGTVYRCLPARVDSCHFTADGDMIFSYKGELMTAAEAQQFVDEHNVRFSVAFGPVLVADGQIIETTQYPIGEINEEYARSCIGQYDKLHYVEMVMSRDGDYQRNVTLKEAQEIMAATGCPNVYTLDGGQTGLVVIGGKVINRPTYGYERVMSDMLCYVTAVPENDRLD